MSRYAISVGGGFQSTLPYGSDAKYITIASSQCVFQSTLPYGSDTLTVRNCAADELFQSTLPYGSDDEDPDVNEIEIIFQSTLPYGSDSFRRTKPTRQNDFNPRSRMGATQTGVRRSSKSEGISIHAPVWERQTSTARTNWRSVHFNPRSRMGATITQPRCRGNLGYFNPRSRMGATLIGLEELAVVKISIHAPVWERPILSPWSGDSFSISIHAPVWERHSLRTMLIGLQLFQSTLPYGSDLGASTQVIAAALFQSTLPYGSDHFIPVERRQLFNFNPRSRMGATSLTAQLMYSARYFNPRSRMGATAQMRKIHALSKISIHAPVWERQSRLQINSEWR